MKALRSTNLPWTEADQQYFKKHKAKAWYIRDPYPTEEANFQILGGTAQKLYETLVEKAQDDLSLPTAVRVQILVLQVQPGERVRLPILGWAGKDPNLAWTLKEDGTLIETSPKDILTFTREHRESEGWRPPAEADYVVKDNCEICSHEFQTGDLIFGFTHSTGDTRAVCLRCAKPEEVPEDWDLTSVGVQVNHDADTPEGRVKMARAMEALKELEKSGLSGNQAS